MQCFARRIQSFGEAEAENGRILATTEFRAHRPTDVRIEIDKNESSIQTSFSKFETFASESSQLRLCTVSSRLASENQKSCRQ